MLYILITLEVDSEIIYNFSKNKNNFYLKKTDFNKLTKGYRMSNKILIL